MPRLVVAPTQELLGMANEAEGLKWCVHGIDLQDHTVCPENPRTASPGQCATYDMYSVASYERCSNMADT